MSCVYVLPYGYRYSLCTVERMFQATSMARRRGALFRGSYSVAAGISAALRGRCAGGVRAVRRAVGAFAVGGSFCTVVTWAWCVSLCTAVTCAGGEIPSSSSGAVNVHTLLAHPCGVPSRLCLSSHSLYTAQSHPPLRPIRAEHAPHRAPRRAFVCRGPDRPGRGSSHAPYTLYTLYSGQFI